MHELQLMSPIVDIAVVAGMVWSGTGNCNMFSRVDMTQLNSVSSAVANRSEIGGVSTSQYPRRLDFFKKHLYIE